jgi:hypothetical protein
MNIEEFTEQIEEVKGELKKALFDSEGESSHSAGVHVAALTEMRMEVCWCMARHSFEEEGNTNPTEEELRGRANQMIMELVQGEVLSILAAESGLEPEEFISKLSGEEPKKKTDVKDLLKDKKGNLYEVDFTKKH